VSRNLSAGAEENPQIFFVRISVVPTEVISRHFYLQDTGSHFSRLLFDLSKIIYRTFENNAAEYSRVLREDRCFLVGLNLLAPEFDI
jgi:hypothetical protein